MRDEEIFAQPLLDIAVESEEEEDARLVASLQLALRRAFDARESCWLGRDAHDSLRRTCHTAEVLHRLSLDAESARVVGEAGTWLINLRLPERLDADRERVAERHVVANAVVIGTSRPCRGDGNEHERKQRSRGDGSHRVCPFISAASLCARPRVQGPLSNRCTGRGC